MTDRLPKKLDRYLLEIAEHESEQRYLLDRLASISFEEANSEVVLLEGLADKGLIRPLGQKIEIVEDQLRNPSRTVSFSPGFILSAEAKLYLEDRRKIKIGRFFKYVSAAITALGGIAAIASFILLVSSH